MGLGLTSYLKLILIYGGITIRLGMTHIILKNELDHDIDQQSPSIAIIILST